MALDAASIATAISNLSVASVSIRDATDIPQSVRTTDCPIFMPMPDGWVGATTGSPDDETTFGTPTTREWITHRVFHYIYLHKMLPSGRGIGIKYSDAVAKTEAIWTALTALDVSGVDVENISHSEINSLQDKANNRFVGCFFDITIRERINP